jgi:signal transduction histidine kinase
MAENFTTTTAMAIEPDHPAEPLDDSAINRRLRAQYAEIARLAGGLAHEIKNPLSTMSLNLDLLVEDFKGAETPRDLRVLRKLERVRKEVEPTDLNAVVDDLRDFCEPQAMGQGIVIRSQYDPDLPSVPLDVDLFKQALWNLIRNAHHAMPDGGELILQTRLDGDSAILDVTDTGVGMSPDIAEKVFDAFYSTKAGGSGLGLPTTRKIVEAHGGEIALQTEPGQGSRFTIRLPLQGV